MKKRILSIPTHRYEKLPAWLQVILSCLMSIALLLVGNILAGIVLAVFIFPTAQTMDNYLQKVNEVLSILHVQLGLFLFSSLVLFAWVRWFEKRPISSLGFFKDNAAKELIKGWLVGALLFSASFFLTYLLGGVELKALDFSSGSILYVLSTVPFWLIQGGTEELLNRGWLIPVLHKRSNLAVAVAVSSSLFGILHLGNNNVTILSVLGIILAGLVMALYMLKTDNIWGVIGLHGAWNFVQGNIFGVAVSGHTAGQSLFRFISRTESPEWISGGAFGTEGSLLTSIVLLLASLYMIFQLKKEKENIED